MNPPPSRPRRTKVVATLGPATDPPEVLESLLLAGVDVVRCNFSHGTPDDHRRRVEAVRTLAARHRLDVAVAGDLQGPKLRIGRFANGPVTLTAGQDFTLDAGLAEDRGGPDVVGTNYAALPTQVRGGDRLMLSDGLIELEVLRVAGTRVECRVVNGGLLRDAQGLNRRGGGLSAPALTDKDRDDVALAAELDMDYLAVSFVRAASDLERVRGLVQATGGQARLIAKIERAEAVQALAEVLHAADAVMVARGDLGVEIGDAELPGVQKRIIALARELNRPCITATQMMESMIHSPQPTRAEVSDVANAVLDGTDAVMLSAETAVGEYPVETVQAMDRIILGAERTWQERRTDRPINETTENIDEVIALAAMQAANRLSKVTAIIAMTESGNTPRLMSRLRSGIPIYAFTPYPSSQRRVAILRGVRAIPFDSHAIASDDVNRRAVAILEEMGAVQGGDRVLITKGNYNDAHGGTNTLKVIQVGGDIQ